MANQPIVVTKSIESALRLLNAAGCQYKIIAPNGDEHGQLQVVVKKKKQMNPDRNYGELRKYYDMFMKYDANVGDVIEIPAGKYPPEDIRGGICAKLTTMWGKGSYVSAIVENKVQILRTA